MPRSFRGIPAVFILCLLLSPLVSSVSAAPRIHVPEPVHQFPSTPEGATVEHRFIIQNTGDEPLDILKVTPG